MEVRNKQRDMVYMAALLHDIGKFSQRADGFLDQPNMLESYSKELAGYICHKTQSGSFSHQHVIWTADFIDKNEALFKAFFDEKYKSDKVTQAEDNLINLAAYHHYPYTELQSLIQLADWWASGIDRNKDINYSEKPDLGKYKYKKQKLYSIFDSIEINGQNNSEIPHAHPLNALEVSKESFSIPYTEFGDLTADYKNLWDQFCTEFKTLPTEDYKGFENTLFYLLKKYLWAIPASTNDNPNISLFEHLKVTASIAQCLYDYKSEHPDVFQFDDGNSKNLNLLGEPLPLRMWCIDISGIQQFIYNIPHAKANKSLKGRSYYIQMIIDTIIHNIISHPDIQATLSHVIYSSGGKCFLILPNTEKANSAMSKIRKEVIEEIWDTFNTSLYVCFGCVAFRYSKPKNSNETISHLKIFTEYSTESINLGELWKSLIEKTAETKNKKYDYLIINNDSFIKLFEPIGNGGEDICMISGEESTELVAMDDEEPEERVLPYIRDQIALGKLLRNHEYQTIKKANQVDNDKKISLLYQDWYFDNDLHPQIYEGLIYKTIDGSIDYIPSVKSGKHNGYGWRYYGGNKVAMRNHRPLSFEELASGAEDGRIEKLGFLRMDVDGLGQIFISGLSDEIKCFSAYATLSNQLDYFFSGYLNVLRNAPKYKDRVNIIYSGGDDLFAVGRWDKIIEFAAEIRKEFRNYVNRDDLTISGGITIVDNKFPIAKAAEMAGEAEDKAKDLIYNEIKKDAINLFGISVNWKEE